MLMLVSSSTSFVFLLKIFVVNEGVSLLSGSSVQHHEKIKDDKNKKLSDLDEKKINKNKSTQELMRSRLISSTRDCGIENKMVARLNRKR